MKLTFFEDDMFPRYAVRTAVCSSPLERPESETDVTSTEGTVTSSPSTYREYLSGIPEISHSSTACEKAISVADKDFKSMLKPCISPISAMIPGSKAKGPSRVISYVSPSVKSRCAFIAECFPGTNST